MASNNEYKVKVGVEFNAQISEINSQIDQLKKKIEQMGSATGNKSFATGLNKDIQEITNRLNGLRDMTITPSNFNRFQAELQTVNDLIQKVKSSLGNIDTSNIIDKIDAQKKKQNELNQEIEKQDLIIKSLSNKQDRNDAQNKALDVAIEKRKKLTQQLNGHKGAEAKLKNQLEATNQTEKEITDTLEKYDNVLKEGEKDGEKFLQGQQELENSRLADTIQRQVNAYIGLGAIYRYTKKYIQDLVQTYKEFDQSLVAIAAVTGQTRDQMWANIGVYNKMAQSLGTTTQEVINASKLYYQQGLTTTSVLKLTEETVKLATIAELDSADATEYLTTAMNGFKLSAEESTRVTDVWANLAAKTASDVDELAVAISKVASLAENAGMEIETASAFLNQMIETTREAPENLGTALKTIIARFQELKTSEEELSDGVDANKVERALKSAGVALRDATGQFRDFDDVILELSSKWDGLDRNTQRYIATIAAGSRQQSRFIALVSDYEGLLRNVNYAYDSLGSADAQMAVFQEGLAASTNRLQAAWEGLYTSWSESATVISTLIDKMADLVSMFADLGAGGSALAAILTLLTVAFIANTGAMHLEAGGFKAVEKGSENYFKATLKLIGAKTTEVALNYALIASYALLAAGIVILIGWIVSLITAEKRRIKQLDEDIQKNRQLAAQEKDRASSLGVLRDELEAVHKAGTDDLEVRQKIIDQFGDEIQGVNILTASYKELIDVLEKEQQLRNEKAAGTYYTGWDEQEERFNIDRENAAKEAANKARHDAGEWRTLQLGMRSQLVVEFNGEQYLWPEDQQAYEQATLEQWQEAYDTAYNAYGNWEPPTGEANTVAKAIVASLGVNDANVVDILASILGAGQEYFDEETKLLTDKGKQFGKDLLSSLTSSLTPDEIAIVANILKNNLGDLTSDTINSILSKIKEVGGDIQLEVEQSVQEAKASIDQTLNSMQLSNEQSNLIKNNLSLGAQKAFVDAFNNLADDPIAQQAYKNAIISLISSGIDPEQLTASLVSSFATIDEAMSEYSSLLSGYGSGLEENAEQLEQLKDAIGSVNATYLEGMDIVNDYYDIMDSFSSAMEGNLDDADYDAKIRDMAAAMEELGFATAEEAEAQLFAATIRDENGKKMLQQTEWIRQITDLMYAEGEAAVESKKAEILAYADTLEATGDRIVAIGEEMIAQEQSGHANSAATQALLENAAKEAEALNSVTEAAYETYSATEGGTGSPMKAQAKYFQDVAAQIRNSNMSGSQVVALGQKMKDQARSLRQLASSLSITKKNLDGVGKSAGNAAKSTDKLKDSLKDLKEQLDDAKEAAEGYIEAVLDFLDQVEDEEEAKLEQEKNLLKIQLQEWKNYIDKRQELAQDALELQGKAADMYFNQEIAAIQAKIDALDDEAEAEDRLLKLQKARDDYNKAQNSRTRLVLTKGAGWIFKTDQNEVTNARKALNDVQREIQKANYQKQLDDLQAQATAWQEIAEKIGESAAEAEKLATALEQFTNALGQTGGYADVDAYAAAVKAQQSANDEYAKLSEEVDQWLEQADWDYQDILDSEMARRFAEQFANGTVGRDDLAAKVGNIDEIVAAFGQDFDDYWAIDVKLQEEGISALQNIAEWYHLLENLQATQDFYNTQKTLLGLTDAELKAAKEMRDAIEKSYDPTAENLGLGEDSKYFNANLLGLIEQIKKLAEQQAALEAQQKAAGTASNSSGGGSGGGGSSGGSGGGITTTYTSQEPTTLGRNLLNSISTGGTQYDPLGTARGSISTSTINSQSLSKTDNKNMTNNYYVSLNTNANNLNSLVQDIKRSTSVYAVH